MLLLNKIDLENTKRIGEKVRQNMKNSFVSFGAQKLKVTINPGITYFKENDSKTTAFERADSAKYKGGNGRNICEIVL